MNGISVLSSESQKDITMNLTHQVVYVPELITAPKGFVVSGRSTFQNSDLWRLF